eukprot:CAMPEP_0172782102 /NCGR_PEP_ID=MMETSP1074-20121228/203765_1 /TAXON_ID=2916 /ORGANISM="Ceratium fusus, Strain PA161109" /LENGTH=30 /DNA_ID= /DNA_START= /DNA_END= /DNA_ORIENTATION=
MAELAGVNGLSTSAEDENISSQAAVTNGAT